MKNWTKVFEDQNQIRVEIVKGVLEDKGVAAFVLNKKESVYQVLVPMRCLFLQPKHFTHFN